MSEELTIIVAMRAKPLAKVVPESVRDICSRCKHPVWLAPSSVKRMEAGPCQVLCIKCVLPLPLGTEIEPVTQEQLGEIERTVGKGRAHKLKEFARRITGQIAE